MVNPAVVAIALLAIIVVLIVLIMLCRYTCCRRQKANALTPPKSEEPLIRKFTEPALDNEHTNELRDSVSPVELTTMDDIAYEKSSHAKPVLEDGGKERGVRNTRLPTSPPQRLEDAKVSLMSEISVEPLKVQQQQQQQQQHKLPTSNRAVNTYPFYSNDDIKDAPVVPTTISITPNAVNVRGGVSQPEHFSTKTTPLPSYRSNFTSNNSSSSNMSMTSSGPMPTTMRWSGKVAETEPTSSRHAPLPLVGSRGYSGNSTSYYRSGWIAQHPKFSQTTSADATSTYNAIFRSTTPRTFSSLDEPSESQLGYRSTNLSYYNSISQQGGPSFGLLSASSPRFGVVSGSIDGNNPHLLKSKNETLLTGSAKVSGKIVDENDAFLNVRVTIEEDEVKT